MKALARAWKAVDGKKSASGLVTCVFAVVAFKTGLMDAETAQNTLYGGLLLLAGGLIHKDVKRRKRKRGA